MAWSLHPTTYPGTYAATQIREFMRSHMNGKGDPNSAKGGWTCGRAGHSVEEDTTCLFTYIAADGVKRYSQFSIDSGSTSEALVANTQINSAFDPTSTDPAVVATYPFVPSVDSSGLPEDDISNMQLQNGTYKINFWVSDENPTAWIGIVNGCAVYSFLPVAQIGVAPCGPKTGTSPEASGYVDYMYLLPQCDGKGATFCGPPMNLVNDDTVLEFNKYVSKYQFSITIFLI